MPETENLSLKQKRSLRKMVWDLVRSTIYFWVPGILFLTIANQIRSSEPLPGDVAILTAIHALTSSAFTTFFEAVTALGSAPFVVSAVVVSSVTLWYLKYRRFALFLAFAAGGEAAINVILKLFFTRERPDLWQHLVIENSYSFPSGHAMISSTLALAVIVLAWRTKYRWTAIILGVLYTLLVGISRLYLGVHYPSDVIGGWCVSILWVVALHQVFAHYKHRSDLASKE